MAGVVPVGDRVSMSEDTQSNELDRAKKGRLRSKAQSIALSRLYSLHGDEYKKLYEQELVRLHREHGLEPPRFRR